MALHFDRFVLDEGARRLLRDGGDVHLSPKALTLLELLVSRRPNAVSKAEIHDALWPATNVVEANIANLVGEIRAALGDARHAPRYIRTVPRFGYRFIAGDAAAGSAFTLLLPETQYRLRCGVNDLGRSKHYHGAFDSPTVSRKHARIVVEDAWATIEDLGSKNGTFIGTTRVVGRMELRDGDVVRLGGVTATFRADGAVGSTRTLSDCQKG